MTEPQTPYTIARAYVYAFRFYSRKQRTLYTILRDLALLDFTTERIRASLVQRMRDEGASWTEVGEALGVSESTARHRYGG